ncbi:hypothetical protein ACFL6I_03885 [candidate division KSB1 bacterium]
MSRPEQIKEDDILHNSSFHKVQLILAEKRTSLAVLRTGIMIFALPLTILTALIAFSPNYDLEHNIWLMVPIVTVSTFLFLLAVFLINRSIRNIIKYDQILLELRESDPDLKKLIPRSGSTMKKSL